VPLQGAQGSRSREALVALFASRQPDRFIPTLRSLARHVALSVVVGSPDGAILDALAPFSAEQMEAGSLPAMVNELWERRRCDVLAIWDAIVVPADFAGPALGFIEEDLRVSTVSFFSNAAGYLSFPQRNAPSDRPFPGDESSTTRKLRTLDPPPAPAPIPMAGGVAVMIASPALSSAGPIMESPSASPLDAIAEFSLRARRKGFLDLLDPGTFYARPSDLSVEPLDSLLSTAHPVWPIEQHPFIADLFVAETTSTTSPFGLAFAAARAKVCGVRVLIDGSCLGPFEMGTQVATLSLVSALAERDDVAEVGVALVDRAPAYAERAFAPAKVRPILVSERGATDAGHWDVGHRPMQPDWSFDLKAWSKAADRTLVSILDLIAYQIGAYHPPGSAWMEYRENMSRVLGEIDGVVTISEDVRRQLELERLCAEPSRVWVAPLGSDHLTGTEPARIPDELLARGYVAGQFLLTIGTDYSHKNRDLAIRIQQVLRERGWEISLVLVGTSIPHGSSRSLEELARTPGDDEEIFVLPDVTNEERNWLLRHASAVLYPSGAEGFGLVPFEAARFGTPTVYVGVSALGEIAGVPPSAPPDWDAGRFADSVELLLRDPSVAADQVSDTLATGASYTWARTAEKLASTYRCLIALPPRYRG
jgi:glycosyltransferase involved in cell wall biosynthesis